MSSFCRNIALICLCFIGLLSWQPVEAQIYDADGQYVDTVFHDHINRQSDDFIKASLLVSLPSNEKFHSVFGHAAIRLRCDTFGLDYTFNYAAEKIQGQVAQYLAGNLHMGLEAVPTDEYIQGEYRSIEEYALYLPPSVEQLLWQKFDEEIVKGLQDPYDCIRGSCAQMMYGYLDEVLRESVVEYDYGEWPEEYNLTIREIGDKYTEYAPWSRWIYFTLANGKYTNDPSLCNRKKLLFPQQLVTQWQRTHVDGVQLLSDEKILVKEGEGMQESPITPMAVAILFVLASIIGCVFCFDRLSKFKIISRCIDWLILLVITAIGLLFTYLVCFSNLPFTEINCLLIPFNPLLAVLWKWRKYWSAPFALLLLSWCVAMVLWPHLLVDPANVVFVFAEIIMLLKQVDWPKMKQYLRKN